MPTQQDILDLEAKIKADIASVLTIIQNNVAGLKAHVKSMLDSDGQPTQEDLSNVLAGLQEIDNSINALPVSSGVVETPPAPPSE